MNYLKNFNELFRKDLTYDNIKSHKRKETLLRKKYSVNLCWVNPFFAFNLHLQHVAASVTYLEPCQTSMIEVFCKIS